MGDKNVIQANRCGFVPRFPPYRGVCRSARTRGPRSHADTAQARAGPHASAHAHVHVPDTTVRSSSCHRQAQRQPPPLATTLALRYGPRRAPSPVREHIRDRNEKYWVSQITKHAVAEIWYEVMCSIAKYHVAQLNGMHPVG